MKRIEVIETHDGKLHRSERDAQRHLDVLLGNVMLPLAKELAATDGKYSRIVDILNAETERMRSILAIKDDMRMEQE